MSQLRQGSRSALPRANRLVQLLVLPSFESAFGYEIRQDQKAENQYFVIHSLWRMDIDLSKFRTPHIRLQHPHTLSPTIEIRQLPLDPDWAVATIGTLKQLMIPAMVQTECIGLDSTSYEIAFDSGNVYARYSWWEEPPSGWLPLHDWLLETVDVLESLRNTA